MIPLYAGTVPKYKQSPEEFAANAQEYLDYLVALAGHVNTANSEILAMADVEAYSAVTTYNLPDTVYGSDGLTYRCAGTDVLGDDPVGSSTGDWVQLTLTIGDTVKELKKINHYVFDPQRMPWNVLTESNCGVGYWPGGAASSGVYAFSGSDIWNTLAAAGDVGSVIADGSFATITNVTSGSGVLTNLVLPGATDPGDISTVRVTVDGVVYTLEFAAVNATDRFVSGVIETPTDYAGHTDASQWGASGLVGGLAHRYTFSALLTPSQTIATSTCLRFESSLKVEMKSSNFTTTNNRDDCAAIYVLDQY